VTISYAVLLFSSGSVVVIVSGVFQVVAF